MEQQTSKQIVPVAKIGAAHGVQGWMKVHSFTQPAENVFSYQPLFMKQANQSEWLEIKPVAHKVTGKSLLLKLPGIEDCDAARQLTHAELAVHRGQMPELAKGEYYWSDLIGMAVVNSDAEQLGEIVEMRPTGEKDLMVINDVANKQQHLIPFVQNVYVQQVDLANRRVTVDWDTNF